ncbi:hypothetical protein CO650_21230 [Rhizobium phaseoli]|nr:hypothetical protein CO650_21230 [Rhizobium phaseoli]
MEVCFAGAHHLLVLHVAKVFLASRAKNRDQITAAAEANEVLTRMEATLVIFKISTFSPFSFRAYRCFIGPLERCS